MGKRTIDFGDLATAAPMAARLPSLDGTPPRVRRVPVSSVAPNPVNHREEVGDLSDLESMKKRQLQACVVVTREAFVRIYPEHEAALGAAEFVIVAGTRRRLAAERFGLAALDVIVQDDVAGDRVEFYSTALVENFHRKNLTPLEEAHGLETLIAECRSQARAGEILGKSQPWVSQRLNLLKLSPAMQDHLRSGDLLLSDTRRFWKLDPTEQEAAWRSEQAALAAVAPPEPSLGPPDDYCSAITEDAPEPAHRPTRGKSVGIPLDGSPTEMAAVIRRHLSPVQAIELAEALLAD